jgi:arylsulfatase A-like enzyme
MFAHSYWILRGFSRQFASLSDRPYWATSKSAEQVTDAFLGWLERRPDRPFFVFLNYFDAHDPYEPPAPFRTMYGTAPDHELSDDEEYTTDQLGPWINAYDGAITYIDSQLARVFAALDASNLTGNTLVIVSSDHGEMFGEHRQIQHTSGVYIPVVHVPLALALPDVLPAGVRVSTPVSLRDIPATVLHLTGHETGSPFRGRSLATDWSASGAAASPVLSEMDFHSREILSEGHISSLIDGPFQYVRFRDGREELYNVVADKRGESNVADQPASAAVIARMRATLDSLLPAP